MNLRPTSLEKRIGGSIGTESARIFLTQSAQFPILNTVLDLSSGGWHGYLQDFPHLFLLPAAAVQAFLIAWFQPQSSIAILLLNLVGPALYSMADFLLEGAAFLQDPLHATYWVFAALTGVLHAWRNRTVGLRTDLSVLLENIARIGLFAWLYWLVDSGLSQGKPLETWGDFISKPDHVFVLVGALLIGLLLGVSEVQNFRNLISLRHLARRLQRVSEYTLDQGVVEQAVLEPDALRPVRVDMAPLFLDVRGFTAWSEEHSPEEVVDLLNQVYQQAEVIILQNGGAKPSFAADEVMTLFDNPQTAVEAGLTLSAAIGQLLAPYQLSIGVGIHWGEVVRGLVGSERTRKYDALGDTMNTASRLEQAAGPGQVLISESAYQQVKKAFIFKEVPPLQVKGKRLPLEVFQALSIKQA